MMEKISSIQPHKRLANLDLVRAVAIWLVLYFHICKLYLGNNITEKYYYNFGHQGVTVFFVLSGFLVGGIYYRKTNIKVGHFWLARFLRTYLPYLLILLISWLSVYLVRKDPFEPGYLLFLQNFYPDINFFKISWSLAVEEHFYLLFALLIFLVRKPHLQIWIWLALLLIPLYYRFQFFQFPDNFGYYRTASFLHLDAIAVGVIAAYLVYIRKIKIQLHPLVFISFLALTLLLFYLLELQDTAVFWAFGQSLANIVIGLLVISAYFCKEVYLAKNKLVTWSAYMAYSLYLVHPTVMHLANYLFKFAHINNFVLELSISLTLIFATAYIFYLLVEQKSIQLRNRILKLLKA